LGYRGPRVRTLRSILPSLSYSSEKEKEEENNERKWRRLSLQPFQDEDLRMRRKIMNGG
jgi:hypothetical protein